MAARLAFRLPGEKWLQIRRVAHDTVELKICFDKVHKPDEFVCRIHEDEFIQIILRELEHRLINEKKE
ncbi:hypothetical protein ACFOU2_02985 [Bacillus songklensis]|uniref:Uncharacterized protein n=1 Tax=Bacillus songklensis TaxID=1069116 RepID=A0ABV8AXV5_9BACI